MKNLQLLLKPFVFISLLLLSINIANSCSMFKITMYGKTMVGNNEDAWQIDSKIWFETKKNYKYGAAYVGHNDLFPQGGMNEAGLAFDGFIVYPRILKPAVGKKKINKAADFIKMILQNCQSVEEVRTLLNEYDRSEFINSMLLFVDKTGKYLVVEVDTTIIGNDQKYVLSNFCPSITTNPDEVNIDRYQRGRKFLENKLDTSLSFCVSMMDTMHECRNKIGDGTTYTSIYDLNEGLINLYFYHDYTHVVKFNLQDELKKGDHIIRMLNIFPPNKEYEKFVAYKTSFNDIRIQLLLFSIDLFLILSIIYYPVNYFRKKINPEKNYSFLLPLLMNIALAWYVYILLTDKAIFYLSSPYEKSRDLFHFYFTACFPIAFLVLIIPIIFFNIKAFRASNGLFKWIFTLNTFIYSIMMLLLFYWKLF